MNAALMRGIRFFTRETEILASLAVACGAGDRVERAADGDCGAGSVFDLASVTKLFTGLCLMKLKEEGLLDFGRPVFSYDPRFTFLKETRVEQLACFGVTLKTPRRLDACPDRETAEQALFDVYPEVTQNHIVQLVNQVLTFLGLIGVIVDPTTAGIGDSERALQYEEPWVDEK